MEITEVRIKLLPCHDGNEKLRGFCSITLDDEIVIRDLKIIEGSRGLFIAMPSRKLSERCPKCRHKNHRRARFCNDCGHALGKKSVPRDPRGRVQLYVDIAHPINSASRKKLHERIMEAYDRELDKAERDDYVYADPDEDYDDLYDDSDGEPQFGSARAPEADAARDQGEDSFGAGV